MNFTQFLKKIENIHPKKIDLSLERMNKLIDKIDGLREKIERLKIIHIAGTNGKGSTVAFLRSLMKACDLITNSYTSPHLVHFRERIYIKDKPADDAIIQDAFNKILKANDSEPITFFELTTGVAFFLFTQSDQEGRAGQGADYLLLEVGLGGRLDATNSIKKPTACVITPISMDHMEFLGSDLTSIAREKAGIIKPFCPVFSAAQPEEVIAVLEETAETQKAPFYLQGRDFDCFRERGRLVYQDETILWDLPLPSLPGRHQDQNAGLALAVMRALIPSLTADQAGRGVSTAFWPARLQSLRRSTLAAVCPDIQDLILDGSHNEAGGFILSRFLTDSPTETTFFICGMLKQKDSRAFLRSIKGQVQKIFCLPIPDQAQSLTAEALAQIVREEGLWAEACMDLDAALKAAQREARDLSRAGRTGSRRLIITGSLYLAGHVLERLETYEKKPPPD